MFDSRDPGQEDSGDHETAWSPECPDSLTEHLEWMLTQPVTGETARTLSLMEPAVREPRQRMLYAAVWQRVEAWASGQALRARVAAARPSGTGWTNDADAVEAELALVLCRTDNAMQSDLVRGRRLETALPETLRLHCNGELTAAHVRAIDNATELLPEELARTVDASVAHRGTTMTVAAFRRLARQAAADVTPLPTDTHEKAKAACGGRWQPGEHGMGQLVLTMPATDGVAALHALHRDATAAKTPDDVRSHGMRLIDAFLGRVLGGPSPTVPAPADTVADGAPNDPAPPPLVRRRAEIQVTIDLKSLLGLREHPGELAGHGPIPAQAVRDLLNQPGTVLRRLVYDDLTGAPIDYSTTRYPADALLRSLLDARDVTCRYPGCVRNAVWCDTEHCDAYDDGGESSCANCGLMCRKHHNLKTHKGFSYRRVDPSTGETEWVTPLGFTYRQKPAVYTPSGRDTGDTLRIPKNPSLSARPPRPKPPPEPGSDPPF